MVGDVSIRIKWKPLHYLLASADQMVRTNGVMESRSKSLEFSVTTQERQPTRAETAPAPPLGVDESRVAAAVADTRWDFRTVEGLAGDLELAPEAVRRILDERPDIARKSAMTDRHGRELYAAPGRPVSMRERVERMRWLLAR